MATAASSIGSLGSTSFGPGFTSVTAEASTRALRTNFPSLRLASGNVNNHTDTQRLLGMDSMATDYPDQLQSVLSAY